MGLIKDIWRFIKGDQVTKSKNDIIISIVLVLIAILAIGYNIFSVEMQKIETQKQIEENANLEKEREESESEMLKGLESEEARQLADYYREFSPIKTEFMEKTAEFVEKMNDKVINTAELKELTTGQLQAALDYKEKLAAIENVPALLEAFSIYELEFIESDIKTINLVLSYYDSENYTSFKSSAIDKLYEDTESLFNRAEEELHRVYEQYDLGYLLERSS